MFQINFESAETIAAKMNNASHSMMYATTKTINIADRTTLDVNQIVQNSNEKYELHAY